MYYNVNRTFINSICLLTIKLGKNIYFGVEKRMKNPFFLETITLRRPATLYCFHLLIINTIMLSIYETVGSNAQKEKKSVRNNRKYRISTLEK